MSKKSDTITKHLTNKEGAFRAKQEFLDIIDLLTVANMPPPLRTPKIRHSLDELYNPIWQQGTYFIDAVNYLAMTIKRDPSHEIYPFVVEFLQLSDRKRLEGDYSLDDLIDTANEKLKVQRIPQFVDYTEVRRLINYYMDMLGSTQARSIMFGNAAEMAEMSMRIACDPSHPDSYNERNHNMKFVGARLPDKNNVVISIDKSTHLTNQQANIGLPSFKDSVAVGTHQSQRMLPESSASQMRDVTKDAEPYAIEVLDLDDEIDEAKIAEKIFINREVHSDVRVFDESDDDDIDYEEEED